MVKRYLNIIKAVKLAGLLHPQLGAFPSVSFSFPSFFSSLRIFGLVNSPLEYSRTASSAVFDADNEGLECSAEGYRDGPVVDLHHIFIR